MKDSGLPKQACKDCGGTVYWIKSLKGRSLAVDVVRVTILTESGLTMGGYTLHRLTCSAPPKEKAKRIEPAEETGTTGTIPVESVTLSGN